MKFATIISSLLVAMATASEAPSRAPSSEPSFKPSRSPSADPSRKPSASPSADPSRKPSADPSRKPSASPSADPSRKPSASPSADPSRKPSADPSRKPSAEPSASPSDEPSLQPTDVPSMEPSMKPSKAPSDEPSTSPSAAPSVSSMPSSTPSAPPTKPDPQIEVSFDGFCFNFVNSTLPVATYTNFYTLLADALEAEIVSIMTPKLTKPGQRILGLTVTDIAGKAVRRLEEEHRQLADVLTEVKYDVVFEQFCERGNCDDASTLTQSVLDLLTTNINAAIDGASFLGNIKNRIVATNNVGITLADLTGMKAIKSGDCSPTFTVKSILPMMWYPDWSGQNKGCIMDGKEDDYMRLNPEGYYLFDTLALCCAKHYSWNYNECAGLANTVTDANGNSLYYPDWEGDNKSCKNDNAQPEYMTNNPTAWMFSSLELCCKARYSWNFNECMGTAATTAGSYKWYPFWESSKCVQDCVGAAPCGGLAESWDNLYDSSTLCCSTRFNWKQADCITQSGTAVAAPATTTTTGATTTTTTTTTTVSPYTNKWYVDYDSDTCKKDCVGAAPCAGGADSWEVLYDTVSACCTGKLWWVDTCGPFAG